MPEPFALTSLPIAVEGHYFEIPAGKSVLGRSSKCDFVVSDDSISRKHAEFHVDNAGVTVLDLRSRNGTFLNERRIAQGLLASGSQLRFGAMRFLFDGDQPAEPRLDSDAPTPSAEMRKATNSRLRSLSPAEARVFKLLAEGLSEKEIAGRLHVSRHTVHSHVGAVYKVFDVHSHAELLALLLRPTPSTQS